MESVRCVVCADIMLLCHRRDVLIVFASQVDLFFTILGVAVGSQSSANSIPHCNNSSGQRNEITKLTRTHLYLLYSFWQSMIDRYPYYSAVVLDCCDVPVSN